MSISAYICSGNMTADAEMKKAGDKDVLEVRLAVNTGYGDRKETIFVRGTKWSGGDKIVQYLKKGSKITVSGNLKKINSYKKQDGETSCNLEMDISELDLPPKSDSGSGSGEAPAPRPASGGKSASRPAPAPAPEGAEDMPF